MHPYRDPPPPPKKSPSVAHEEMILYGLMVVIGAMPVVLALAGGTSFGVEATVGLLMVCAGALGASAYAWRTRRTGIT